MQILFFLTTISHWIYLHVDLRGSGPGWGALPLNVWSPSVDFMKPFNRKTWEMMTNDKLVKTEKKVCVRALEALSAIISLSRRGVYQPET